MSGDTAVSTRHTLLESSLCKLGMPQTQVHITAPHNRVLHSKIAMMPMLTKMFHLKPFSSHKCPTCILVEGTCPFLPNYPPNPAASHYLQSFFFSNNNHLLTPNSPPVLTIMCTLLSLHCVPLWSLLEKGLVCFHY